MLTTSSFLILKGISSGKSLRGGTDETSGEYNSLGSQSGCWSKAVVRSLASSEMALHSAGHGLPPKASLSERIAMSISRR